MDWKYKHFHQEAVFDASRERVLDATRNATSHSLDGWHIANRSDGFIARGHSAAHAATATFHVEPVSGGMKVAVELLVERASPMGFMLIDIGGYYNGQIRKWLSAIAQQLASTDATRR